MAGADAMRQRIVAHPSVPVDVLAASLFARYRSRVEESYADQMLSAMRFGFGGHVEMPQ